MMAERATPLPFSSEKVEKAREAINILSSLSLPGSSRVSSQPRDSSSLVGDDDNSESVYTRDLQFLV